jgi:hypothetical protein
MRLGKGIGLDECSFFEGASSANQMGGGKGMNCCFNLGNNVIKSDLHHKLKIL